MVDEVALTVGGDRTRARAALDVVGLGWASERHPRDLSSGERERLGFAAVTVGEPDLLVLDEPTRGIDPDRKIEIAEWLFGVRGRGHGRARRDARPRLPGAPARRAGRREAGSWRRSLPARALAARCASAALAASAWAALDPERAPLAVLLVAVAVLVGRARRGSKAAAETARDLTLVATLGGLAAAGRVLFAPVPSVQPVTVIVAASGVALGPRRGFAVGALAALASNFFLGQGPHTPWQMLAWGGCGRRRRALARRCSGPARVRARSASRSGSRTGCR